MRKSAVAMLVLFFLTASCLVFAEPASSSVDISDDAWAAKASMQQARAGLGVVAVNGKIYAIGGTTSSTSNAIDGGFVGTNEEYDPAKDTWTYRKPMPTPRAYFAIAAYQNKIYCIGGAIGFSVDERTGFYSYIESGVNEVYDTVTNVWETKKPLPFAELKLQASVVNGKIYVVGGAYTYVYDPESDSWALRKQVPVSHPLSVVVDNKIVVTGEFSTGLDSSVQKILIYDTETDSWSEGTSGPTVVVEGAAGATTGVKAPQKVYVLGLMVEALLPTVVNQVYDPKTDTWATAIAMPANRSDFGVVVVNDILYAIGGYLRSSRHVTPVAVNEQYTPIGYGAPPEIKVVSPVNQTYNESSLSLVFTVDKLVNWMGYSLDGQDNVTLSGNTTLAGLPYGSHNLTVYATDAAVNTGASDTITFTITKPETFPTALVATASGASVAVIGIALLMYFKKRNH
jgi:N-acetylneuraminic acid mutarotase